MGFRYPGCQGTESCKDSCSLHISFTHSDHKKGDMVATILYLEFISQCSHQERTKDPSFPPQIKNFWRRVLLILVWVRFSSRGSICDCSRVYMMWLAQLDHVSLSGSFGGVPGGYVSKMTASIQTTWLEFISYQEGVAVLSEQNIRCPPQQCCLNCVDSWGWGWRLGGWEGFISLGLP